MADSATSNYRFVLPEIGASKDNWGAKINQNFISIDATLKNHADLIAAAGTGTGGGTAPVFSGVFDQQVLFRGHQAAEVYLGAAAAPVTVASTASGIITHGITAKDLLTPHVPSEAYSILTRQMADSRYMPVTGDVTVTGKFMLTNGSGVYGNITLAGPSAPFAIYRRSDGTESHAIWPTDVNNLIASSNPSIMTRRTSDARYTRLTTTSDARLKENIEPIGPQLNDILAMQIVSFNMLGDDRRQFGMIAQDLKAIRPDLVVDDEGYFAIKYPQLIPMLVKAVQELAQEVRDLRNRAVTQY